MKKLLFLLLLVAFWTNGANAQVTTETPNLGLSKPCVPGDPGCAAGGHPNWGPLINENFDIIDAAVPTLNLKCTDGQVPTWASGKFSICGSGAGHAIYDETTLRTSRSKLRFLGAGVTVDDNSGEDATDVTITGSALSITGTGIVVQSDDSPQTFITRTITGTTGNISCANGDGVAGNPTCDLGTTAVQTDQSNTYTTGDQNAAAASSWTVPLATGAAPTLSGRIAYDSTANKLKFGANGVTFTIADTATTQALNANLTALSGLTGAAAKIPHFTAVGTMALSVGLETPCTATGTQALNLSSTSPLTFTCGAITGGISGTSGTLLKATSATTAGNSIITEAGGNIAIGGGLSVGDVSTNFWRPDSSAVTGEKVWTVQNQSGTVLLGDAAGTFSNGSVVTATVVGGVVTLSDGGAAGSGDVTLAGPNVMNNTTLDEAAGNVIKVTKSIQVELFGPTTDNASGNGQYYFRVPVSLNGTNLVGIQSNAVTAGTTGLASVQITRCAAVATSPLCSGTTASMLTTVVSIDSGETSSSTAATPAVINAANDDVATGQILRFDVTAIHTTPAKGLFVNLDFKLP